MKTPRTKSKHQKTNTGPGTIDKAQGHVAGGLKPVAHAMQNVKLDVDSIDPAHGRTTVNQRVTGMSQQARKLGKAPKADQKL